MDPKKGLFVAAAITEVTGVVMVLGSLVPGALDPAIHLLFGEPVAVDAPARLGMGIAGALMAGWGITVAMLARAMDALSPHVVGSAIAAGIVAWFVLDGISSVVNGAAMNLVGNLVFLVILLPPALKLRASGNLQRAV